MKEISGLSGPAIYAASRAVKTIAEGSPPARTGENQPILWAVVEAQAELESMPGDRRRDLSWVVVDQQAWRRSTGGEEKKGNYLDRELCAKARNAFKTVSRICGFDIALKRWR